MIQSIKICWEIMFSLLSYSSCLYSEFSFLSIFLIVIVLFLSSIPLLQFMYDAFFAVLFSIFSRSFSLSSFVLSFYNFPILSFMCSIYWVNVLCCWLNLAFSRSNSMNKPIFYLSVSFCLFSKSLSLSFRVLFSFSSYFWNSSPLCSLSDFRMSRSMFIFLSSSCHSFIFLSSLFWRDSLACLSMAKASRRSFV